MKRRTTYDFMQWAPEQIAHLVTLVELQIACGLPDELCKCPTTVDQWVLYWSDLSEYYPGLSISILIERQLMFPACMAVFEEYFNQHYQGESKCK